MSQLLYTVSNLVEEVRAQVDEQNVDSVSTESDILPSLNRAQDYAFDILARRYQEPILQYSTLELVGDQSEYDIPEDIFEDRVQKIEIQIPSGASRATYREVERISYRDLSSYESASATNVPYYYCIIGRKIRFVPTPTGTYPARMWSLRNPEKLTMPQGRITIVNSGSSYVILDQAGANLSTESDQLESYVNVVDGQTGVIKGTLQVQILSNNKVTFRTVPTRSTVLNREVSGSMASMNVLQDDYLSPVDGTCVPFFSKPICNFLIQFAVSEITRKLGGAADMEERVLEKFEKQVERTWAGRETTLRIKKRSNNWGPVIRRLWFE